ncbi:MAG: OmpA family protein [Kofleriaceae bacterium]
MASVFALRALLGASLGLGALDVAWLNLELAPRLVEPGEPPPAPSLVTATATEPPPAPVPVPVSVSVPIPAPAPPPAITATKIVEPQPAAEPPAEPAPRAVIRDGVFFETRSARLDSAARDLLAKLARDTKADQMFVLEGHADHRGDDKLNQLLSKARAVAVADKLAELGIPRARIRLDFVGEDLASTTDALWRDRRVDIQITGGHP